mmetsp:Transcript_33536/g.80482  ORF Transcript_33536/g.80482 Transcript_33536/m.80482 type:complete len:379 (+) Transcript_33536:719-1855(+)
MGHANACHTPLPGVHVVLKQVPTGSTSGALVGHVLAEGQSALHRAMGAIASLPGVEAAGEAAGLHHRDGQSHRHRAAGVDVADLAAARVAHRHLGVQHEATHGFPLLAGHGVPRQMLQSAASTLRPVGLTHLAAAHAGNGAAGVDILVAAGAAALKPEALEGRELRALEAVLVQAPVGQIPGDGGAGGLLLNALRVGGLNKGRALPHVLVGVASAAAVARSEVQFPERRPGATLHGAVGGELGHIAAHAFGAGALEDLAADPVGPLRHQHREVVQAVHLVLISAADRQAARVHQAHACDRARVGHELQLVGAVGALGLVHAPAPEVAAAPLDHIGHLHHDAVDASAAAGLLALEGEIPVVHLELHGDTHELPSRHVPH